MSGVTPQTSPFLGAFSQNCEKRLLASLCMSVRVGHLSSYWTYCHEMLCVSIFFKICRETYVYWTVHHLDSWIKIDQLDVTCFVISLFTVQRVSNVSTSIFRSLRLIVDLFHGLYSSGPTCVGVTVWFGWGGVVSLCRLKQCFSLHKDLLQSLKPDTWRISQLGKGCKKFSKKNLRATSKILGARSVIRNKFHTENPPNIRCQFANFGTQDDMAPRIFAHLHYAMTDHST